jgi:hypothetical protein
MQAGLDSKKLRSCSMLAGTPFTGADEIGYEYRAQSSRPWLGGNRALSHIPSVLPRWGYPTRFRLPNQMALRSDQAASAFASSTRLLRLPLSTFRFSWSKDTLALSWLMLCAMPCIFVVDRN